MTARSSHWFCALFIGTLAVLALACNFGGNSPTETSLEEPPAPPLHDAVSGLGERVEVTSAAVGAAGGLISVKGTDGPLEGMEIAVPAGAYAAETSFQIAYREMPEDGLGDDVTVLAPLIKVEAGEGYAAEVLTLKVPVNVPEGHFAMGFFLDPATGELDAMPVVADDENSITLATRHFSEFTAASVPIEFLDRVKFETGFQPGYDMWDLSNYGSHLDPEGFCSGMNMAAIYHFTEEKPVTGEGLWGLYDNTLGSDRKTPNFWQDNDTAIRLVAVAQNALTPQAGFKLEEYYVHRPDMTTDQRNFYSTAFALHLTKKPQLLGVYKADGSSGHSLICYEKEGNELKVVDPSYAGGLGSIWIDRGAFKPYTSASNTAAMLSGRTFVYPKIRFYGLKTLADWELLRALYMDSKSDRIGRFPVKPTDWQGAWHPTYFPDYTLLAVQTDPDGNRSEIPLDPMVIYETDLADLDIQLQAPSQFEGRPLQLRVVVYRWEDLGVREQAPITLRPGVNLLGFLVEGYTQGATCSDRDPGWCWVGFDWITVELVEEEETEEETTAEEETAAEPNACNALADVQVLVKPTSVDSNGEPTWTTSRGCKASIAFVNTNPEVEVRVLVRQVDEENPDPGEWLNFFTEQVAPEEASYSRRVHVSWDGDGVVTNWKDMLEYKAFYTGAGFYHCNDLADDPAGADLPTAPIEHPCRDFDPKALPSFSQEDCACGALAAPSVTGEGGALGYSCTYDWGSGAAGLNNIKLTVSRHDSDEAAAEAYAWNRDRVATGGVDPGVVTQATEESANSYTRVNQQTNTNHVFYGAWWGHRVVRYGKATFLLYLAGKDLGGAGDVIAALNAAQACAEAAVDRYQSACEAVPIGCEP